VLGLIDEVAEKSEFYPVYPKKTSREKKRAVIAEKRPVREQEKAGHGSEVGDLDLEGAEPTAG
jgi:hypothetical protein